MSINVGLLPRPWSCDEPRVEGYSPLVHGKIERVSRRKRNGWRCQVFVDKGAHYMSHHDTKADAERAAERMIKSYADAHYRSR